MTSKNAYIKLLIKPEIYAHVQHTMRADRGIPDRVRHNGKIRYQPPLCDSSEVIRKTFGEGCIYVNTSLRCCYVPPLSPNLSILRDAVTGRSKFVDTNSLVFRCGY